MDVRRAMRKVQLRVGVGGGAAAASRVLAASGQRLSRRGGRSGMSRAGVDGSTYETQSEKRRRSTGVGRGANTVAALCKLERRGEAQVVSLALHVARAASIHPRRALLSASFYVCVFVCDGFACLRNGGGERGALSSRHRAPKEPRNARGSMLERMRRVRAPEQMRPGKLMPPIEDCVCCSPQN